MVINASVSAASLPAKQITPAKPATQPAATSAASAQDLSVSSEYLAASSPEITSDDEAQQSTDFAVNSILNQSSIALLAQGQHQSQTVIDLLAQ